VSSENGTLLLEAVGMASGYNGNPVIRDIDLQVGRGEVVALLGPNGAGKSTTIMTLAGQIPVLEGEVRLDGKATTAPVHRRTRNGMAVVTEKRSVFMRLTAAENLRLGRCDRKKALDLFPELERLLGRLGGQLSGGEQQILTLARALARNPRVLLADELSLGLAPMVVTRLLTAVRRAADEDGVGVLLVEQHVGQALRYADRVYAIRHGSIVAAGTPTEVAPVLEDAYLAGASA
jgi:branched-chain amino acid transport system ATP-binding protein